MPLIGQTKTDYQREYMRRLRSNQTVSKEIRQRAGRILQTALRKGELVKPSKCEACHGKQYIMAHHPDYEQPLEVLWVCSSCHKKLHLILSGKQRKKSNPYINPLGKIERNLKLQPKPSICLDADGNFIPEY